MPITDVVTDAGISLHPNPARNLAVTSLGVRWVVYAITSGPTDEVGTLWASWSADGGATWGNVQLTSFSSTSKWPTIYIDDVDNMYVAAVEEGTGQATISLVRYTLDVTHTTPTPAGIYSTVALNADGTNSYGPPSITVTKPASGTASATRYAWLAYDQIEKVFTTTSTSTTYYWWVWFLDGATHTHTYLGAESTVYPPTDNPKDYEPACHTHTYVNWCSTFPNCTTCNNCDHCHPGSGYANENYIDSRTETSSSTSHTGWRTVLKISALVVDASTLSHSRTISPVNISYGLISRFHFQGSIDLAHTGDHRTAESHTAYWVGVGRESDTTRIYGVQVQATDTNFIDTLVPSSVQLYTWYPSDLRFSMVVEPKAGTDRYITAVYTTGANAPVLLRRGITMGVVNAASVTDTGRPAAGDGRIFGLDVTYDNRNMLVVLAAQEPTFGSGGADLYKFKIGFSPLNHTAWLRAPAPSSSIQMAALTARAGSKSYETANSYSIDSAYVVNAGGGLYTLYVAIFGGPDAWVYIGGAWKEVDQMSVYIGGAWKTVDEAYLYSSSRWKLA